MHLSVLQNAKPSMVQSYPFPHIVIENALPLETSAELTSSFPKELFDINSNNKRLDLSAPQIIDNHQISDIWRKFINYHTSQNFFLEFLSIFSNAFSESDLKNYKNLSVGTRGISSINNSRALLDAQISINTPVKELSSVRLAHADNTNKLFSGLYYLKQPEDKTFGGNLQLLEWNKNYNHDQKLNFYKEGIDQKHFSVFKEVEYKNNTAVLFLNSIDAIHLVTEREATSQVRCFANLVCELNYDLFKKETFIDLHKAKLKSSIRRLFKI